MSDNQEITDKLIGFIRSIGLPVEFGTISTETFLPGILIDRGTLIVDREKLLYPGDLIHEAGHLAVIPFEERNVLTGNIAESRTESDAEEIMVIGWSYAACVHLKIDPHIVFHDNGYKGGGKDLVDNFINGRYIGVPMLQWVGMTKDEKNAANEGISPYPFMLQWLR